METLFIQWLGTAGFAIDVDGFKLLIDPYLSRLGLIKTFCFPLRSNKELIDRHITGADYILSGHSHYDHIMDVPYLASKYGAQVIGTKTTCNILRGSGIPEAQLREVAGGEEIEAGPFTVLPVKSLHGKPFYGFVPIPGVIDHPLKKKRLRVWDLKEGRTLSYYLKHESFALFYQSGGDLIDSELEGITVDILLTNISARHKTFTRRLLSLLRPKVLIPCHFDNFFLSYHYGVKYLPTAYFRRFFKELHEVDSGVEIRVLGFFEEYRIEV